ncbi:MAG: phosphoenolpyruvate carboxylase [Flavobacteriaceae bacterium]|nr:phosphoenolpyruvate carboxylase [Flavobacteriaceae bacterium]MCY4268316.1 phosphoenolpyruvate carboxylase [Flavobacteriaceae bacterium]
MIGAPNYDEESKLERFNDTVLSQYRIFNSLFLTLPFDDIRKTSILLPLFYDLCKTGYQEGSNPKQIVENFCSKFLPNASSKEQLDLLFRFIQYIERQIVLFDAIEDAAFYKINNRYGRGSLRHLKEEIFDVDKYHESQEFLKHYNIRIVLTAHPTQFYPDTVLILINDLSEAIKQGDINKSQELLIQLGMTPFFKKKKPTPYDEAVSLLWYLENVFYHSVSAICNYLSVHLYDSHIIDNPIFDFGFWPGGDRDGNPYVTPEITLKTANRLKFSILRCYYKDIVELKKKITFPGVDDKVLELERKLYYQLYDSSSEVQLSAPFLLKSLQSIVTDLEKNHNSLYINKVIDLVHKVKLFGTHFANLDLRQDSRVHHKVFLQIVNHPSIYLYIEGLDKDYEKLKLDQRLSVLSNLKGDVPPSIFEDEITRHTLESIRLMKKIQTSNGERSCNRYIVSNTQSIENILQLFAFYRLSGWKELTVDFIPLFETIHDLKTSLSVMKGLYSHPKYRSHLKNRKNHQTIMLGFSDGTKDGGYLMANWSIYLAKQELSQLSHKYGLKVTFFDGRGGPPARGGGNTHQFYASRGNSIVSDDIQLTIQGQTISSNFGSLDSSRFNFEQLLSAGVRSRLLLGKENTLSKSNRLTLSELANKSYQVYTEFKQHPQFVPYLQRMSTLHYYAKTNIGSRPAKRGQSEKFVFENLRAIPFVGSWSMLKQNVPGFYGVGSAINEFKKRKRLKRVIKLFNQSRFFRTLVFNSMMSLTKSFFDLTAYMKDDDEFGAFWKMIYDEYVLTKSLLLEITEFKTLMEYESAGKASIKVREDIALPLLTIQQFALQSINQLRKDTSANQEELKILEKLVVRSLFGNINASRNSA